MDSFSITVGREFNLMEEGKQLKNLWAVDDNILFVVQRSEPTRWFVIC